MARMNMKTVASGFAALVLTVVMSWTFVDATKLANLYPNGTPVFAASISALVR